MIRWLAIRIKFEWSLMRRKRIQLSEQRRARFWKAAKHDARRDRIMGGCDG